MVEKERKACFSITASEVGGNEELSEQSDFLYDMFSKLTVGHLPTEVVSS